MVVNFRVREISRGMRRLVRTPTLIKKKILDAATVIIPMILHTFNCVVVLFNRMPLA